MKQDSMLARLMASLGAKAEAVAPEAITTLQAEFDAFKVEAQAQQTELAAALETAVNAVQEADAKVEAMQAELAALKAEADAAAARAAEAKLADRKAKITAAVGNEKADALMAVTNEMDDASFTTVLSAMSLAVDKESQSAMFTEQGAAAEVDANSVVAETAEMKILREKYKDAE